MAGLFLRRQRESLKADGIKTYLSSDGLAGVGVKADGDITAVFKHPKKLVKGSSRDLMAVALANGGNKLDCYGSVLAGLYAQQGFIPVARVKFIDEYANAGWDESKGRPDIYFMMHNGDSVSTVAQKFNQYPTYSQAQLDALPLMEYDDAYITATARKPLQESIPKMQAVGEQVVIGKGNMGEVVKIGDSVYKNSTHKDGTKTLEGEVYQALKGNDNVLMEKL